MATTYRHECDRCGYTVTTVEPQQRADGRLVARLYCPACGEAHECVAKGNERHPRPPLGVPIGPRQGPAGRLAAALAGRLWPSEGALATIACPVCGGTDLTLAPVPGQEPPCPRCERGRMIGRYA